MRRSCSRPLFLTMFLVTQSLQAVRLDGDTVGAIVTIPADTVVKIVGEAHLPGLTEVVWDGKRLALFRDDLMDRSVAIRPGGN